AAGGTEERPARPAPLGADADGSAGLERGPRRRVEFEGLGEVGGAARPERDGDEGFLLVGQEGTGAVGAGGAAEDGDGPLQEGEAIRGGEGGVAEGGLGLVVA